MSKIRLWNLGVLDGANSIIPTRAAINRLREILGNIPEEGVYDIVWGPELSVTELGDDNNIENYTVETMTEKDGVLTLIARKVGKDK